MTTVAVDTDAAPTNPPANKPANVALIAGLLSWVPGVGAVAAAAGVLGMARARVTRGAGRNRSFLGMVLGIGGLMLWAMLIGAYLQYKALLHAEPARKATEQFAMLVGTGNAGAARALCLDTIDLDRLTDTAEQLGKLGTFAAQPKALGGKPLPSLPGGDGVQVEYELPYEKATKLLQTDWQFVDGQPRLADYRISDTDPDPATQPATPAVPARR